MKRIPSFFILLCVAIGIQAQIVFVNSSGMNTAKETLDSAYLKVSYSIRFVQDTDKPENIETDQMLLLVGKTVSQFYSFARFQADSLLRTLSPEQMIEVIQKQNRGKFSYDIYKNYPDGKVTTTDRIATTNYKYEEPYDKPDWEIYEDTMNILGYACQKATCSFRGRDYIAWFTMDIPVSNGPWKFGGLPGLILNIADTEDQYIFECSGIETPRERVIIGMDKKNYAKVSKKDFNKVYQRYISDPVGFISTTAPNIKISMRNADGTEAKGQSMPSIPYNPIER